MNDPLLTPEEAARRLSGTRAEEGMALLKEASFHPVATMREAAQEIVELIGAVA